MFAKVFLLFALVVVASATSLNMNRVTIVKPAHSNESPAECSACVQLMDQGLNILLNEILSGGVIASCGALCGKIPEKALALTCDVVCGYVGIKEFIRILNKTDPDPIYYCQELKTCPIVVGGAVKITNMTAHPISGPVGTKFEIAIDFTVINATSTGMIITEIAIPDNEPLEDDELSTGLPPNQYNSKFALNTADNKNNDWYPGTYKINFAICAGDCTTAHPNGGIYDQASTTFVITQ